MHEGLIALAEGICEKHKTATDVREMRIEARRLIHEAYKLGARDKEAELLKPAPPVSRIAPATQESTPSTSEKPAEVTAKVDTTKSPAERRKPGPKSKAEKEAEAAAQASVEAPKEETPADAPQPDAAAATESLDPASY